MISKIKVISIESIYLLINYFENKSKEEKILNLFGVLKEDNLFGTLTFIPDNKIFKYIQVFFDYDNKLTYISFLANSNLTFQDFVDEFKVYREEYSFHDDLYFYFFEVSNSVLLEFKFDYKINHENINQVLEEFTIRYK